MAVHIVTDSTCDLPREFIEKYEVTIVPLKVLFGEEEFRDGIDISNKEFYRRLTDGPVMPRTSQPTPGEFEEVFRRLAGDGDTVISIHISAALSGTYQSASLARKALPELDIEVVDTQLVSLALGLVVLEAARAAALGWSKQEILELVNKTAARMVIYFIPATLAFLERGGRIGKASALLGSILDIKPILSFDRGAVVPVEKVRTRTKGLNRIFELLEENFSGQEVIFGLVHANEQDIVEGLVARGRERLLVKEVISGELGPVVGTHGGPGIVGIMAVPVNF